MNSCLLLIILLYCSGNNQSCVSACNKRQCFNSKPVSCHRDFSCNSCGERNREVERTTRSSYDCNREESSVFEGTTSICQTPPPVQRSNFPYLDSEQGNCGCEK